ncbi:MAG: AMP-dependent synthetase/ligase [Kiritimatiellia bacterium]|jgi:long-chain acyl-CoA synthetase
MSTIRTLLLDAAAQRGDGIALRWKSEGVWRTWTYADYLKLARMIAEAVGKLGIKPGQRVAMMLENRPEWMVVYLGLACCGIQVVPIDARLQEREVAHILNDSEACALFASGKLWPLINEIAGGLSALRHVIFLDGAVKEPRKIGSVRYHDYDALLASAEADAEKADAFFDRHVPAAADIASIIYTSGTTGRPKGAMLTHGNFIAQLDEGAFQYFTVHEWDNFLLVLPLHHALAFTANMIVPIASKCEVSMIENLRTITENMREVSPTILLAVPLLAEKMHNAIMAKLRKNFTARILLAIGLGRIVGKKVIDSLGGRLRIIVCGGAAADVVALKNFTKFGIKALEGYGLTETAPIITLAPEKKIKFGTVGKALPNCEIRIADPTDEGVGEIQVRGPMVMKGYFRNEAATAEVFDGPWFRTGDLGKMDSEGYVTITGRKKSLIVNREGKNIYPEEVEMVVNASPYILESIVVGYHAGGEKGERVGIIVVPDMDRIGEDHSAKGQSLSDDQIVELCKSEVRRMAREIAEYKHPRRISVRFEPFQKTTTQKIKRYLYSMADLEE